MRASLILPAVVAALLLPASASAADELLGVCAGNLCVASPGGAPTALTTDGGTDRYASPAASADGQRITYVRDAGLWRAGPRNATPERLLETATGDTRDSAVSADGQSFAFRTFEFRGGAFQSSLRIGGAIGSFLWSGNVVVPGFVGNELIVTQAAEGQPKEVACRVALIPDGPPPCGQLVAADPARDVSSPTGSPDGRFVAATAIAGEVTGISLFDAATGALVRDLTAGPGDSAADFSPDGSQVVFTRGTDTWVVPTAGGEPRLLVAGMTTADWYATPAASGPSPGPGGPSPTPTPAAGRPKAPKARLGVKQGRVSIVVRCGASACAKTTWTFKQGKKTRLKVVVPALAANAKRTLKVKVPKATARRIGRKGLKLRLTGKGLEPRTVRFVRG